MATEREIQKLAHDVWQDDGGREGRVTMATEQEIKSLAFQLWREDGEPEGKALAHWDRATEMLNGSLVGKPTSGSAPEQRSTVKPTAARSRPAAGKPGRMAEKPQTRK
jgi:hypothetical protein